MSIFDDPSIADSNIDLLAQDDATAQRRLALQQQALVASRRAGLYATPQMIQTPGFTSAVTGQPIVGPSIKPSLLANVTPLLADTGDQMDAQRTLDAQRGQRALAAQFMQTKPPDDAPIADHLAWAQKGMQIPSLAPTMKSYADYLLTKAPGERQRANQADVETFLKGDAQFETQRHNLATEGKEANPNYVPIVNDAGVYTGSFDTRNNVYFDAQGRPIPKAPEGTPKPDQATSSLPTATTTTAVSTPDNDVPGPPGTPANAAPAVAGVGGGVRGKSSGEYQKSQDAEQKTVTNSTKALAVLADMPPLFAKANTSGFNQAVDSTRTFFTGKSTPQQDALDALALKGSQLAKFADRSMYGPSFSNADVEAINNSVGNFKAAKSVTQRVVAYNELVDTFRRGAGLAPLGDDDKLTVDKLGISDTSTPDGKAKLSDQSKAQIRGTDNTTQPGNYKPPKAGSVDSSAFIQQWNSETPARRPLVEQRMLGMTYKGHVYQGGDPSKSSSWSK